ncbi:MAG: ABC transporter ATP-binding protein [Candidatus Diapherotrites archaeon]|uniref:ABC transporter ATP-binding protein n=1 Tax=Candidatus Iainarchaeum sp. TaxID=3101447 RepID=A0A8T3YIH2_9ARCH|nr:ABC transporter ATP-binding protein [Candidatus Diapherotrites archaeon]
MDALEVKGAVKQFREGGNVIKALDNVSMKIREGEIVGLLGPNGAGKTTLISATCGLLELDSGEIKVFGKDALAQKEEVSGEINLITGFAGLLQGLSVENLLRYYAMLYNVREKETAIENVLAMTGLAGKRKQVAVTLSSGYKQRFYIAKALLSGPRLLLMDEPTVGLDVKSAMKIRMLVKKLRDDGKTILLTTHYMQRPNSSATG